MNWLYRISFFALLNPLIVYAQVGIGTISPNASLEVVSSNEATPAPTDGILIPKVAEFPASNPSLNQDGMLVYATGGGSVLKGFYYWDNAQTNWIIVGGGAGTGWSKTGDTGTNPTTNFIGTTDAQDLAFRTNNVQKMRLTAKGQLEFFNTGNSIYIGDAAGNNDDLTNNQNTVVGDRSGVANTTGNSNNFFGRNAGVNNVAGSSNVAVGVRALGENNNGNNNVSIGNDTGGGSNLNTSISGGVFLGHRAGFSADADNRLYIANSSTPFPLIYGEFDTSVLRVNGTLQVDHPAFNGYAFPVADGNANEVLQTDGNGAISFVAPTTIDRVNDLSDGKSDNDGSDDGSSLFLGVETGLNDDSSDNRNAAFGFRAMRANSTGARNTAVGYEALFANADGINNVAHGYKALTANTSGSSNTANGEATLFDNTTGSDNTAYGARALFANTTGSENVAVGFSAGVSNNGSNNIFLGSNSGTGSGATSNRLYIETSGAANPLVYGEFDNDILRVNGTLQVSDPAGTGFAFPAVDGATNQVLRTDGAGQINWQTLIDNNTTYNATNGITENTNQFRLGGSLVQNTTITHGVFDLQFNLTGTGSSFSILDAGVSKFFVSPTDGNIFHGGDGYWRDNDTGGPTIVSITDDADDGRLIVYENGSTAIDLDANSGAVFNEQGSDRDFRVESENNPNLLRVDAALDVVVVGAAISNLNDNNLNVIGATLDYVADFQLSSTPGTTVGIGSFEYIADVGNNQLAVGAAFMPSRDNSFDLGFPSLRWDNVWATNGTIQTSDIRDKENIKALDYGLAEVLQLNPISFQWKNHYDRSEKIGFSAQQLQQLIPEVVKDHYFEHPEDGSAPIKKEAERLGVYYSDIIPVLVKAIQQQEEKITALENRLNLLENK